MAAVACMRTRVSRAVSVLLVVIGAVWPVGHVKTQALGFPTVNAWLTTVDQASLLAPQAALSFASDSGSSPLTIDLDPATTYQAMDGFGASFTDSSSWLIYNKLATLPADSRRELLVRLFDRSAGIGLSYLRQPIGASDFALSRYSYDDMPAGQTDPGVARFSIEHDRAYILPLLREALSINPELRIVASPWSAPAWMKSSGSLIDGRLNSNAEKDYAAYLVKFIQAYEAEGVPIDRLTPQNEPHYTPVDYPGMWMDSDQQAEFVGTHLGPAMAAAGLRTRIDAWDHNWDDVTYAPHVLGDAVASSYVSGTAWHCYAGSPAAMTTVHDQYPAKDVLLTECSGGYWHGSFADGFAWDMENLIIAGTRNYARAIIKWNIALDTNHGPHTGGCTTCTGLVTIDQATGTVASFNYDYYSLGHISKFVAGGAQRIASNTFGASSIQDVAFSNPDGSTVLIVFNADGSSSHTFKVREAGRSFSYSLPPRAAATFTWSESPALPPAAPNLAFGRPAVASSAENATLTAANAVDGSTSTRWSSAFADPQWLRVDLGARYTLSSVVLSWEAAFAVAYQLQVSDDGTSWTTVYTTALGHGGTETIQPTVPATGRYVRIYCTQRTYVLGQQWGYSLWELQVFGSAASPPPPSSSNLAFGRPAVASSTENATLAAANAVDGSTSTRWSSAFADPQWLRVDLGARYALSSVVLSWEAAFAVAYQLQVSDDGTSWTTVYATALGHGGTETIQPSVAATGRYVRIYCTQRTYVYGQQWGYSLWELQVFGSAATPPSSNLAFGRPAVASGTENATLAAANAVDGSTSTRWSSAFADPQWLRVDLGARYTLSSIVLSWEAAFAVAYQLQVSDDGTSWTTVYATTLGHGGTETIQPSVPATGRYVRIYCTQRTYVYGQQWGYSLWEFQVFGTP